MQSWEIACNGYKILQFFLMFVETLKENVHCHRNDGIHQF